ncbi:RES family NAD+ phosphorylase [Rheinheimera sp. 1928-s]|uniref:RES family NAD+ phosphorylase n=1 Tax=Rheinheimera sp. 1928-s TaxID=3033803 RepID=UPI0026108F7D|nr:RES family NAD+ phosphorylase [Rheinheimera sp. 1928-s]MDF3123657.1 RES family NAD+ phosphorylase [Rheinheimera sp. 1928-s]
MEEPLKLIELNYLDRFRQHLMADDSPESVERHLRWYLEFFGGLNIRFGYDRPIVRARICADSSGFSHISELFCPPPEITNVGRMNDKGNPMFYAAYHIGTAIAEINAKEGDIVQVAQFQLPETSERGLRCLIIGEIYNAYHGTSTFSQSLFDEIRKLIERLGKKNIRALLSYLYMDALSSELLNDVSASKKDYIYSRTLSRLLLEKHPDIDGLIFPSAKIKGTSNIVLRPGAVLHKAKVVSSHIFRISKLYPYGLCDFELIKEAKGEGIDGRIIW